MPDFRNIAENAISVLRSEWNSAQCVSVNVYEGLNAKYENYYNLK